MNDNHNSHPSGRPYDNRLTTAQFELTLEADGEGVPIPDSVREARRAALRLHFERMRFWTKWYRIRGRAIPDEEIVIEMDDSKSPPPASNSSQEPDPFVADWSAFARENPDFRAEMENLGIQL